MSVVHDARCQAEMHDAQHVFVDSKWQVMAGCLVAHCILSA